jgi:hypothetical protein
MSRIGGEYKWTVERKAKGKPGNLGEVAGVLLLCPTPLPDRTPREYDSKSKRLEGKQRIIPHLCIFFLTNLFTIFTVSPCILIH